LHLIELASAYLGDLDLVDQARPILGELVAATGETVHLGILAGTEIVYVDKAESEQSLRMVSRIGSRNPVHCTALGKSIIAFAGEEYLVALAASGLERRTPNTLVELHALRADLAEVRIRGYAVDCEENKIGLRCIGAEIRDHQRRVVGAISISGPSVRVDDASVARLSPLVRRAADQISRGLGYLPVEGARVLST
jgi:DNA-binding IclR family transcriptional regulator